MYAEQTNIALDKRGLAHPHNIFLISSQVEALQMSTYNICFCGEIRKITALLGWKSTLSGVMLTSALTSALSDMSLPCLSEETLHPWLSEMHPVKILVRLHKCAN